MLAPYSVSLYFDQSDSFRCRAEDSAQVDAYIKAMRVVQQRTGTAPRSALNNCAPVHIESLAGSLSVVRVSDDRTSRILLTTRYNSPRPSRPLFMKKRRSLHPED